MPTPMAKNRRTTEVDRPGFSLLMTGSAVRLAAAALLIALLWAAVGWALKDAAA